ncbi:MAG: Na+/H+ antiporter NhaC family protein [Clostridia bacterium]|nr:Na+/H+ antiporter NhaC family protein [Clostridia bacterium]
MSKSRKILLAVVAVAIVGLLAFAFVSDGALATAPCVDCGGAGLVEEVACETCGGEGNVRASWWALVPPVIAIGLALITKEVYSSLFIGILAGAILSADFSFTGTMDILTNDGLISAVSGTAGIFVFLVVLGVLVALINKSGASAAFGRWAETHIKSRTGAMLATFVLGVLIFIDDYFNCLTVGSVMRPVTDSQKVSRAKLAYLIDATAAPICMIAPISSWAAAVASYAEEGQGLSLFIKAIPFNFYSLLTLVFIVVITLMKFDYGPMRIHEINAKKKGDLYTSGEKAEAVQDSYNPKGKVIDLVLPVLVLIAICIFALLYVGGIFDGLNFIDAFGNTDATVGLPWGSIIALVITIAYLALRKVVTVKEAMECIPKGFIAMVPAILILTFATSLKNMTAVLGAQPFVNEVMGGASAFANFLPAIIFLVACFISFATGTSWGTFGILIPIVTIIFEAGSPLQLVAMSACLAGSVCGDHCSPISDTTIMSSAGGQCNHLNHVSTQLPYAISVAAISFVMYIVSGFVPNAFIVLPVGIVLTVGFLFVMKAITAKKYGKDNI